jgi:hypothetical protein
MTAPDSHESPSMGLPEKAPCAGGCAAPLADLQAAMAGLRDLVDKQQAQLNEIAGAINAIGALSEQHATVLTNIQAAIGDALTKFGSMGGPMGLLKMMGGKRG